MQISKFKSTWIIFRTICVTLRYSFAVIFRVLVSPCPRPLVDKYCHAWAHKLLNLVKLSYVIHNPHNVRLDQNRSYILMSNHASHYDIPLIFATFPGSTRMLAKKELFSVPIWGRAMKAAEFIFIDRDDREQAVKDLHAAKQKMLSGIQLWVAPEGTRSRTGELGMFKKGGFMIALQTDAIIVPITICGSGAVLPPDTLRFNLNQRVDIHIGEPVDAKDYTLRSRNKLVNEVKNTIKETLERTQKSH